MPLTLPWIGCCLDEFHERINAQAMLRMSLINNLISNTAVLTGPLDATNVFWLSYASPRLQDWVAVTPLGVAGARILRQGHGNCRLVTSGHWHHSQPSRCDEPGQDLLDARSIRVAAQTCTGEKDLDFH